jgi:hypothetical protein
LTEVLELIHGEVITVKVKHTVLESTTMAVGKDEAITVDELGVLGVKGHELVEQNMSHWGTTHGGT